MWGNFILAYHHFFQVAQCNDTHETCMKFFALHWSENHELSHFISLVFEEMKPNPPYLTSTCYNVLECESSSCVPKKLKPYIVLQRVSYPLLTHHQNQLSLLEIQRVIQWESSNWASIYLLYFGRWPIWLQYPWE